MYRSRSRRENLRRQKAIFMHEPWSLCMRLSLVQNKCCLRSNNKTCSRSYINTYSFFLSNLLPVSRLITYITDSTHPACFWIIPFSFAEKISPLLHITFTKIELPNKKMCKFYKIHQYRQMWKIKIIVPGKWEGWEWKISSTWGIKAAGNGKEWTLGFK